jgi:hypothetical protein
VDNEELSEEAMAAHERFTHPKGDHFTLLCVWREWERSRFSEAWARSNFLKLRPLRVAKLTLGQLRSEMKKLKAKPKPKAKSSLQYTERAATTTTTTTTTNPPSRVSSSSSSSFPSTQPIIRAFIKGYCSNAAKRCSDSVYQLLPRGHGKGNGSSAKGLGSGPLAYLESSGALSRSSANTSPPFALFHELVMTSRPLLRTALAVEDDDVAFLMECRAPLDNSNITAQVLSGQKPLPAPSPLLSSSSGLAASAPPPPRSAQRTEEERVSAVDSARERYLQRKRARGTK